MKKRAGKARIAEIERKIETQRKRAARPQLPVNSHAQVGKSLKEKREAIDRKARQKREWGED